jgi:hypothetical protein
MCFRTFWYHWSTYLPLTLALLYYCIFIVNALPKSSIFSPRGLLDRGHLYIQVLLASSSPCGGSVGPPPLRRQCLERLSWIVSRGLLPSGYHVACHPQVLFLPILFEPSIALNRIRSLGSLHKIRPGLFQPSNFRLASGFAAWDGFSSLET